IETYARLRQTASSMALQETQVRDQVVEIRRGERRERRHQRILVVLEFLQAAFEEGTQVPAGVANLNRVFVLVEEDAPHLGATCGSNAHGKIVIWDVGSRIDHRLAQKGGGAQSGVREIRTQIAALARDHMAARAVLRGIDRLARPRITSACSCSSTLWR